ncbi:MAG: hypothetical protein A2358_03870 [Candidatus Staskawiczbacteria bacterium RIFOXYB1_FULL_37_44]|uniref:Uncharacterized protein n=1 Tax=Candidatus Staskawiczbacteria bacterium RIFOXYB1_FULL_37_44 TaxID=1802223 RepID=A0A1G2IW57_9BACT|nr:MAG: hypothetical protein A2358_03870 [Candidatus Staskawiczbacteria bacterium RIFOXYB1_FULL_37_44]
MIKQNDKIMKVAISQPEHFPYLGYFEKMAVCDIFVILDNVQFSGPRSWQNRNRFINKSGEWQWFTVPVAKNSYFEKINDVKVAPDLGWRNKLIKTLSLNFPGNPKFDYEKIYNSGKLVDINMESINLCRNILEINTPMIKSSEIPVIGIKAELIYNICKYLKADIYISGQGAKDYLKDAKFKDIEIKFIEPKVKTLESTIVLISNDDKLKEAKEIIKKLRNNE